MIIAGERRHVRRSMCNCQLPSRWLLKRYEPHGISFWDAMLWATAQPGCTVVLSEDMQDGRWLGSTEIINPFEQENDANLAI